MKNKEELLKDFKKANSARKLKLAEKNGFTTTNEYLEFLQGKRKTSKKKEEKVVMDYVICFDTTGSMGSYINDVKKHVKDLIPDMFSKGMDLYMRIVAFGDYCDMKSKNDFGNAYQESEFTNNENELINFVNNAKNTSGGDEDEFYELVIKKITEETPWREGSKRVVLFIADSNTHKVGYSYNQIVTDAQVDWRKEAKKAAELNISFDTLAIHGDRYPWYKGLSSLTNGVNMPFKSTNKMNEVFTASAYVRGSSASKASFSAKMAEVTADGDEELIGTYKSLSKLL